MWIQSGRLAFLCLGLSLLFSPGSLKAEVPLTEGEIRAWAAGKGPGDLTNALVRLGMEFETLNTLYMKESEDWKRSKREFGSMILDVKGEMGSVKESLKGVEVSFEKGLKEMGQRESRAKVEIVVWRVLTGAAVTGIIYVALVR